MEKVEKEPLLSAKNKKLLKNPLGIENPITVQVLGICSALAVTSNLKTALVMSIALTLVTGFSNLFIASIRAQIPGSIRMAWPSSARCPVFMRVWFSTSATT